MLHSAGPASVVLDVSVSRPVSRVCCLVISLSGGVEDSDFRGGRPFYMGLLSLPLTPSGIGHRHCPASFIGCFPLLISRGRVPVHSPFETRLPLAQAYTNNGISGWMWILIHRRVGMAAQAHTTECGPVPLGSQTRATCSSGACPGCTSAT